MSENPRLLFDLDNNLWETNNIYVEYIGLAVASLAGSSRDPKEVGQQFRTIMDSSYPIVHVNPDRQWPFVLTQMKAIYGCSNSDCKQALEILMNIYNVVPDVYPDVFPTLYTLREKKYELGAVSHGKRKWIYDRLDRTGLAEFFPNPKAVNVNGPKDERSWRNSLRHYGASKNNSVAIGDSLLTDVVAAFNAGIKRTIWVRRPSTWAVQNKAEKPLYTEIVSQIAEIVPVIDNMFGKID